MPTITPIRPIRADGEVVPGDPARIYLTLAEPLAEGLVPLLDVSELLTAEGTLDAERRVCSWLLTVAQVADIVGEDAITSGYTSRAYRITAGTGDELVPLAAGWLKLVDKWTGVSGLALNAGSAEAAAAVLAMVAAEAAKAAAETAASDAEQARTDVLAAVAPEALDATMAAQVSNPSSATGAALSATFAPVSRAVLRPGRRWMFFGDSITNGSSASNFAFSYTQQACHMGGSFNFALDAFEAGTSGDTSALIRARAEANLATYQPGGVHLQVGTNDSGTGVTLADFQKNVAAIVAAVKARGLPMTIGTVPPRATAQATAETRRLTTAYNLWIKLWAPSQGIEVADTYAALVDPATGDMRATYSADGVHPNTAGHTKMAQVVSSAMLRTLSTKPPRPVYSITSTNCYPNPLMTGTTTPNSTYAALDNTGTAGTYTCVADTSGELWAGQWAQIDVDAAATTRAGRDATISTGWAAGDVVALSGIVQVDDVTGSGAWEAAVAAGTAGVSVGIVNGSSGVGIGAAMDRCAGRVLPGGAYQIGPFWKPFTLPAGLTSLIGRISVTAPSGLHVRARFGALGIINLTTLGVTADGAEMTHL